MERCWVNWDGVSKFNLVYGVFGFGGNHLGLELGFWLQFRDGGGSHLKKKENREGWGGVNREWDGFGLAAPNYRQLSLSWLLNYPLLLILSCQLCLLIQSYSYFGKLSLSFFLIYFICKIFFFNLLMNLSQLLGTIHSICKVCDIWKVWVQSPITTKKIINTWWF